MNGTLNGGLNGANGHEANNAAAEPRPASPPRRRRPAAAAPRGRQGFLAGAPLSPPPPPRPGALAARFARSNSMGSGGAVSDAFSGLAEELTAGRTSAFAVRPSDMKRIMAKWRSDFAGYSRGRTRHDAHEFLAALLDGLHEDLNLPRERSRARAKARQRREAARGGAARRRGRSSGDADEALRDAARARGRRRRRRRRRPQAAALLCGGRRQGKRRRPAARRPPTVGPRRRRRRARPVADTDDDGEPSSGDRPRRPEGRAASELLGAPSPGSGAQRCDHSSTTHESAVCVLPLRGGPQGAPPPRRMAVRLELTARRQRRRRECSSRERASVGDPPRGRARAAPGDWTRLVLAEVWHHKIHKVFVLSEPVDEIARAGELGSYVLEAASTARRGQRLGPEEWIEKPNKNSITMVAMTLHLPSVACGRRAGASGSGSNVEQCSHVIA
ncbi:hypothetical protein JL721_9983 [Aureococcus anophagefferens]|nr:hypothetical protein JL721_9983 [Aureococcus anophagefferens]